MKRVAVISDSHQATGRVERFIELAQRERFDQIIHCGDGESDMRRIRQALGPQTPVAFVGGNCDYVSWNGSVPRELTIPIEGVRIYAVHGDRWNVKLERTTLSYRTEEVGAQVAVYGHTHRAMAGYVGRILVVNPGALKAGEYAVLEIDGTRVEPKLLTI